MPVLSSPFGAADYNAVAQGATTSPQSITVTNEGDTFLAWTDAVGGAITVNISTVTARAGQKLYLKMTCDATGSRVITWGTGFQVSGTNTLTANKIYLFAFTYEPNTAKFVMLSSTTMN